MKRLTLLLLISAFWLSQGFAQGTQDSGLTSYAIHVEKSDTPLLQSAVSSVQNQHAKDDLRPTISAHTDDLQSDSTVSEPVVIDALFLYPNPTSGMVKVKLPGKVSLQIYTLTGQLVSRHQLAHGEKFIDLSALPSGIYQIRAKSEEDYYSGKLLIQN